MYIYIYIYIYMLYTFWCVESKNQKVHHNPCLNLFILYNNSFDNQGSEINKNIFLQTIYIYIYMYIYIYCIYIIYILYKYNIICII